MYAASAFTTYNMIQIARNSAFNNMSVSCTCGRHYVQTTGQLGRISKLAVYWHYSRKGDCTAKYNRVRMV